MYWEVGGVSWTSRVSYVKHGEISDTLIAFPSAPNSPFSRSSLLSLVALRRRNTALLFLKCRWEGMNLCTPLPNKRGRRAGRQHPAAEIKLASKGLSKMSGRRAEKAGVTVTDHHHLRERLLGALVPWPARCLL